MTPTADIDHVVREVLAELTRTSSLPKLSASSPNPSETPVSSPSSTSVASAPTIQNDNRELVLASRLVTMNEVTGRLAGIRRMVLRPGTVITPAVKDEIKQRNIQVTFSAAASEATAGPLRLVIVAARMKIDPQPFAATLPSEGIDVELHSSKCLMDATDRLAGEVKKPATLGLMLTTYEAEAMCLANRLPGVRAISGRAAGQVAADIAAVGANVLVINPKRIGAFEIRQMLSEFCRGGVRPCPEVLKQRLI